MRGQHKFYHWSFTVYTGLSLAILSYEVIICGGTLIIFEDRGSQPLGAGKCMAFICILMLYTFIKIKSNEPIWLSFTVKLLIDPGKVYLKGIGVTLLLKKKLSQHKYKTFWRPIF